MSRASGAGAAEKLCWCRFWAEQQQPCAGLLPNCGAVLFDLPSCHRAEANQGRAVDNHKVWEATMRLSTLGWSLTIFLALSTQALAHHAMGGQIPVGLAQGLLSGLAHPVIAADHLAFVLAVGVLTAVSQGGFALPAWFVGGTIFGCLLNVSSLQMQPAGWMVPLSALLIGGYLASGREDSGLWHKWVFLAAGALHGLAYSQAIIGSESYSLQGYLIGFAIVQILVAWAAMTAAYGFWRGDRLYANARVFGGVLAGVGVTTLYQASVASVLPGV
jgi:urease accessory protein